MQLQSRLGELKEQGLGLAAISYDPVATLAAFSKQHGIGFPLLSDPGSATIKRYGILNTIAAEGLGPHGTDPNVVREVKKYVAAIGVKPFMAGIPFPGTFMLDRSGRVRARFFEDAYEERDTVSSILMRTGAGRPAVNATRISGDYLEITTYPSDAVVSPGNRFSIAFDIVPKPRIHVYAPGAKGYRIIGVTIARQPFLRVLPLKYPNSEIYFFKPLNERVPVYEKPFTLMQDVMIDATPEAQAALRGRSSITLTGTVDYQACDDKLCFNPVSVPLSWTLSLRPLVRERPTQPR